jgi:tetratricopeptide (TPR) repeat protein
VLLARQHQSAAAVASFRRALELRPDWAAVQTELAWVLATSPEASLRRSKEAVSLAEHSVSLTGRRDAHALDVLAASLATDGQFDLAIAAAEGALGILERGGESNVAGAVRDRLGLYRNRIAYLDSQ